MLHSLGYGILIENSLKRLKFVRTDIIDNMYRLQTIILHVYMISVEIKAYNNVNHEIEQGFGTCSLICLKERAIADRFCNRSSHYNLFFYFRSILYFIWTYFIYILIFYILIFLLLLS